MNAQQITDVAAGAGFSGSALPVAVAIALAESGGNPGAHNPIGADDSYGLWQINMRGTLGPARRAAFGLTSNDQLYDPATNARAAFAISGGGSNFNPWTTFTSGAYRRYLAAAPTPSPLPAPGGSGGPADGTGDEPQAGDTGGGLSPLLVAGLAVLAVFILSD